MGISRLYCSYHGADIDSVFSFWVKREIDWKSGISSASHSVSHQILSRVTFLCIVASSSGSKTDQSEVNMICREWLTLLTFKIFHLGVWADAFYRRAEQFTLLAVIVSSCLHFDLHSFHIMKIFIATVRMRDLIIHWNSSVQKMTQQIQK